MLPFNSGLRFIHLGCSHITRAVVPAFVAALEKNHSLTALQLANGDSLKIEPLPSLLKRNEIYMQSVKHTPAERSPGSASHPPVVAHSHVAEPSESKGWCPFM